jgi:hypothetical protein
MCAACQERCLKMDTTRQPFLYMTSMFVKMFLTINQLIIKWANEFNPDWLSLQFVPYAFHEKGLPYTLGKWLFNLGQGRKWHIMFHEAWVGLEKKASINHQIIGELQRFIIKQLIVCLKAAVIHTHTQLYQIHLSNLGFTVRILPLFGNIPVIHSTEKEEFTPSTKDISFVLFGGIHHGASAHQLAYEVAHYTQREAIKATLILVGRCGKEAEHWVNIWKAAGHAVQVLGEQPAYIISTLLQKATIGLTTTPIILAEKSGTVAAMREHGLPVLCVRLSWKAAGIKDFSPLPGVIEYQVGTLEHFLKSKMECIPDLTLEKIGIIFAEDLTLDVMDNSERINEHSN